MIQIDLEKSEAILLQAALLEYLSGFEFDKDKLAFHATTKALLQGIVQRLVDEIGRN